MEKYDPKTLEQRWYETWESAGYFAPSGQGPAFSIAIPPPNVTGTLHMGHAFQHSLVDAVIRRKRMQGYNTLWQMGTDHAGISTQLIVAEQLAKENLKPLDIGREAFIKRAFDWKDQSGGQISQQLRRMGASLHWETERFTLDEGLSLAVIEVFTRLFEEDLIYRGKRLVNWDPKLETSISDLEVISEEENGFLWHIRYPMTDMPTTFIEVATTRPETMLGDAAVAVHPDDPRYKHLIGQSVSLPLSDRVIPVIADHYVDPSFGTGCVKITPAHDFNDYDVGQRHDLPLQSIMNPDGTISDHAPIQYQGLDRFDARRKIVEDLDAAGLLVKVEDHKLMVPRGEKSGVVVEPLLSDQWFVQVGPLAEPAIKAVENGDITFNPKQAENIYFAWMRDLKDWCISRQQWWGHRIPAWYNEAGEVFVGKSEASVRARHQLGDEIRLRQDDDVLDTWFSSALWTFSTLGWPEDTEALKTFHSTDLMVTGHDIISFWVSRMIMMTLKFMDEVPFKEVYIHGLVTDAEGQKMSKSKGNGLDPMDIIDGITAQALITKRCENLLQARQQEKIERATRKEYPDGIAAYGTDALRFTFCAIATSARAMRFDLKRVEGYRNFCNKLWNAANYVLMSTDERIQSATSVESVADQWIRLKFQETNNAVNQAMDDYRFDLAAKHIYEFVWDEFCDWYLELCKPVLLSEAASSAEKAGTQACLLETLEATLRLAHPFMPFITEELWQKLPQPLRGGPSLMLAAYPAPAPIPDTRDGIYADIQWIKEVVGAVRNIRGEQDIPPNKLIPILLQQGSPSDRTRQVQFMPLITALARPETLSWIDTEAEPPPSAIKIIGDLKILVPLAGLIDVAAELERIDKEINKILKEIARIQSKLSNDAFVKNAPADIVDKEKTKIQDYEKTKSDFESQKARIQNI